MPNMRWIASLLLLATALAASDHQESLAGRDVTLAEAKLKETSDSGTSEADSGVGSMINGMPYIAQKVLAAVLGVCGILSAFGPSTFKRVWVEVVGALVAGLFAASALSFFGDSGSVHFLDHLPKLLDGRGSKLEYFIWVIISVFGVVRFVMRWECAVYAIVDVAHLHMPKEALNQPLLATAPRDVEVGHAAKKPKDSSAPTVGMEVCVTNDAVLFEQECKSCALSWPNLKDGTPRMKKLGATARVQDVDTSDSTVSTTIGWIPIRCLVGFEAYKDETEEYVIMHDNLEVTAEKSRYSEATFTLSQDTVVNVAQVAQAPPGWRARIVEPSGWITLKDNASGKRFVRKKDKIDQSLKPANVGTKQVVFGNLPVHPVPPSRPPLPQAHLTEERWDQILTMSSPTTLPGRS